LWLVGARMRMRMRMQRTRRLDTGNWELLAVLECWQAQALVSGVALVVAQARAQSFRFQFQDL
jgi:hypothetical protein